MKNVAVKLSSLGCVQLVSIPSAADPEPPLLQAPLLYSETVPPLHGVGAPQLQLSQERESSALVPAVLRFV